MCCNEVFRRKFAVRSGSYITALLFVAMSSCCFAFTVNDSAKQISSSGSLSDTQSAVDYVVGKNADGWVLTVGTPGAKYVWDGTLSINLSHVFTIQGGSPSNRPTITLGPFKQAASSGISINATSSKVITLKDFVIHDAAGGPTQFKVIINGNGVCFRVTNIKYDNDVNNTQFLWIGSNNTTHTLGPYGLIDHCEWALTAIRPYNCIFVIHNGDADHWGWTQNMSWGTQDCVTIEDCVFNIPGVPAGTVVDGYGGARITYRHNVSTNFYLSIHGRQSGAGDSTLQMEIYNNTFGCSDTVNGLPFVIWLRGGTAVIYNNTITQVKGQLIGTFFRFSVECASPSNWQAEHCDRQLFYPQDYPAKQQVGRGVVSGAEGAVPIYVWNNTYPSDRGGAYTIYNNGIDGGDSNFIVNQRDVYEDNVAKPGYTALAYPHPLQTAGSSNSIAPPSNLSVGGG